MTRSYTFIRPYTAYSTAYHPALLLYERAKQVISSHLKVTNRNNRFNEV